VCVCVCVCVHMCCFSRKFGLKNKLRDIKKQQISDERPIAIVYIGYWY